MGDLTVEAQEMRTQESCSLQPLLDKACLLPLEAWPFLARARGER